MIAPVLCPLTFLGKALTRLTLLHHLHAAITATSAMPHQQVQLEEAQLAVCSSTLERIRHTS